MNNCSFCGRRPVIHQRYSGVYRCDRCLIKSVEKRFRQTVNKEEMISPGDRVMVAVSGGKDSMSLLYLLANYSEHKDVKVAALTIDEGIEGYRDESLELTRDSVEELGVEHVVVSFKEAFGAKLDELAGLLSDQESSKPDACTYCGILRRTLLNQSARELGADKLATGHNLDDEVQTIMLNYVRGDIARLSRFGRDSPEKDEFVSRIKPLREVPEKELTIYALLQDLGAHIDECPYIGGLRSKVRRFLNDLEVDHPTTKFKILRMFERLESHLPDFSEDFELKECEYCGEPSPKNVCRTCELLRKIGLQKKKTLISEEQLKKTWR
ncbi:MAG: TIGR00269 family protein [Hadesarchaea archaeon]|nr:TIGR00269 family protein [Hadesarchaea archaeon]